MVWHNTLTVVYLDPKVVSNLKNYIRTNTSVIILHLSLQWPQHMPVKHCVLVYYLMIVLFVQPEANVSKLINVFVIPIILVISVRLPHVSARIPMILRSVRDSVHVLPMIVAPAQWVTQVQIAVSGSMEKHTPSEVIH